MDIKEEYIKFKKAWIEKKLTFGEMILLKQFLSFARSNPIEDDEPFIYPFSVSVAAGESHTFKLTLPTPRNRVYYFERFGYTQFDNSEYSLSTDGKHLEVDVLPFDLQSESSQWILLHPPKIVMSNIQLKVTNNDVGAHTYQGYFAGWKRWK